MSIMDMITQGESSVDILILTPSTFIRKVWGQDRRIFYLVLGVKGLVELIQSLQYETIARLALGFQRPCYMMKPFANYQPTETSRLPFN